MSTDLVPIREPDNDYMPVMSIDQAVQRREMLVEYTRRLMVEGQDFGTIPGAGNKKVLLKPGAEKLATIFGLTPQFEIVQQVERWEPDENGELLFSYVYRCSLYRGGRLLANADGSCNSREKKYRYRQAQRVCPQCGGAFIIKGKEDYGGGWLCFKKNGGCGAKFPNGSQAIEGQPGGQQVNPDVADLVNTLQKMAAKRALIAATLLGVNASEFFTQDLEDFGHGQAADAASAANGNGHHANGSQATSDDRGEYVPQGDPVQEAAEAEQAKRDAAEQKKREEEAITAAFAARMDSLSYTGSKRVLAKALSGKDKPTFADMKAALEMSTGEWNAAIILLDAPIAEPAVVETTLAETEIKANENQERELATAGQSKATLGAMAR